MMMIHSADRWQAMNECVKWLKKGNAIVVFVAANVNGRQYWIVEWNGMVERNKWKSDGI